MIRLTFKGNKKGAGLEDLCSLGPQQKQWALGFGSGVAAEETRGQDGGANLMYTHTLTLMHTATEGKYITSQDKHGPFKPTK